MGIDENAQGCTLIIAHRLSTLRTCDRIIVMEKGCIKESGPHNELMKIEIRKDAAGNMKTGWYRDLYETQHGKSDTVDLEKLEKELAYAKQQLSSLKLDNLSLRCGLIKPTTKAVSIDRPLPPLLELTRHATDTCCQKVAPDCQKYTAVVPPPYLELARGQSMP